MPGLWDPEAPRDNKLATPFEQPRDFRGEGHDRLYGDNLLPGVCSTIAMPGDTDLVDVEITAGQKMLSAMSGSLFTSLLGKPMQ